MSENAIFISLRPNYAKKIFQGIKTVELRRIRPKNLEKGSLVFIYESSPKKSLTGAFKIDRIIEKPIQVLWEKVQNKACITREEFDSYYKGISKGVGFFFSEFWNFSKPLELQVLKKTIDFYPPQGFRYLKKTELFSLQINKLINND